MRPAAFEPARPLDTGGMPWIPAGPGRARAGLPGRVPGCPHEDVLACPNFAPVDFLS
jgi:hypothetical protein